MKTRRREVRARIFSEKIPSYFKAVLPKLKSIENLELIRDATKKHAAHLEDENMCILDSAIRCDFLGAQSFGIGRTRCGCSSPMFDSADSQVG